MCSDFCSTHGILLWGKLEILREKTEDKSKYGEHNGSVFQKYQPRAEPEKDHNNKNYNHNNEKCMAWEGNVWSDLQLDFLTIRRLQILLGKIAATQ